MGEPWEEGDMRNDELEVGSGGSRRRGSEKGLLHGSHLLSPLVEAGPAECLGQESGSLSLQKLGRECTQGAVCPVQPGAHTRSPCGRCRLQAQVNHPPTTRSHPG